MVGRGNPGITQASLDDLFSDSTYFKLNFIGIQHLEYLDIREIKTLKNLLLTFSLLNPTPDTRRVEKPLHITMQLGSIERERVY